METFMDKTRGDWNTQKAQFKTIVEPIKQNMEILESHVRELEQKRQGAYEGLKEQLRQLSRAHAEIHSVTISLRQALKSPVTRGRWGEIQLRRIVELARMTPHVDFTEQKMAQSHAV
jgi:DNA recombination protein RmuC